MPSGLEASRLTCPILAAESSQIPSWPGSLQRIVMRRGAADGDVTRAGSG
jgi:hypothetical protein